MHHTRYPVRLRLFCSYHAYFANPSDPAAAAAYQTARSQELTQTSVHTACTIQATYAADKATAVNALNAIDQLISQNGGDLTGVSGVYVYNDAVSNAVQQAMVDEAIVGCGTPLQAQADGEGYDSCAQNASLGQYSAWTAETKAVSNACADAACVSQMMATTGQHFLDQLP